MERNPKQHTIQTLVALYKRGKICLNPKYQRGPVWSVAQKRMLVDTILRNMDVPKIYFRKVSYDGYRYEVVDGQQRLRTIVDFFGGKFKTEETEIGGQEIPAMTYNDLCDKHFDFVVGL